ncbi:hypothetical protein DPMN_132525 [Dreissena polymorpha]|uniref:Uncharacterized protein n=1 Tax=Dreissena polymorpha TaxID=45954 RepID=A0A9D4JD67_DREPO|nr:hypothetical protein DPMN_132525 [Dreissena polymorpha]
MNVSRIVGIEGDPTVWVPSGNMQTEFILSQYQYSPRLANTNILYASYDRIHLSPIPIFSTPRNYQYSLRLANTNILYVSTIPIFYTSRQYQYSLRLDNTNILYVSPIPIFANHHNRTKTLFMGTSSMVEGLAVDWISNNIYWADSLYDWIMMVSMYAKPGYKIVVRDGLTGPSGVVVHPEKGKKNTVECAGFNGKKRRVVAHQAGTIFFGIAVYDYPVNLPDMSLTNVSLESQCFQVIWLQ